MRQAFISTAGWLGRSKRPGHKMRSLSPPDWVDRRRTAEDLPRNILVRHLYRFLQVEFLAQMNVVKKGPALKRVIAFFPRVSSRMSRACRSGRILKNSNAGRFFHQRTVV